MEKLNELKKLPEFVIDPTTGKKVYKPLDESTSKWLDGMERCWQEFLKLHREGHIPHISDKDIQNFLNGDSPIK